MKLKTSVLNVFLVVLVLCSLPFTGVTANGTEYNPIADVDRDWDVDIFDVVKVAGAYGSEYILVSEPNKTTITVLDWSKNPPEVENARVTVFETELFNHPIGLQHTNSLGVTTFELSPNKNYTAIAWSGSAYNFIELTTNTLGEASIPIILGDVFLPSIRSLPQGWIVITFINNQTGSIHSQDVAIIFHQLKWGGGDTWSCERIEVAFSYMGIYATSSILTNQPYSRIGVGVINSDGAPIGYSIYSPDESGCANVIVSVLP